MTQAWGNWEGTIPTSKGPLTINGSKYGPFVISSSTAPDRKTADTYTIDHIPSGTHIFGVPMGQQKLAKGIVIDLMALPGIDWEASTLTLTPEQLAAVWEVCHPPPVPKVKRGTKSGAKKVPLFVQAVYPPYFTPSDDLRTYDQLNEKDFAEGRWPRFVGEVARLLGLEVMMVRFTVGKRAPLLPDDVYEYAKVKGGRAFAEPQLPPGFPRGYAGCRQIIEGLWKLGTLIDTLADLMITYHDTAEASGQEFDDSQWLYWDRQFKDYIIKGWANWSIAAVMFEGLPKSDKQKITGKLGYVGGLRMGYHPLGLKTFLRSEKLPRLREVRRLRIYGVERKYQEMMEEG